MPLTIALIEEEVMGGERRMTVYSESQPVRLVELHRCVHVHYGLKNKTTIWFDNSSDFKGLAEGFGCHKTVGTDMFIWGLHPPKQILCEYVAVSWFCLYIILLDSCHESCIQEISIAHLHSTSYSVVAPNESMCIKSVNPFDFIKTNITKQQLLEQN